MRRVVLEYFNRAGIDLKPEHEVHNVVHAISMITSTRAVMLLPAYTKRYLPESITTRPVQGEAPTLDLVLAYHKANKSPILKLLLSKVGKLAGAWPECVRSRPDTLQHRSDTDLVAHAIMRIKRSRTAGG